MLCLTFVRHLLQIFKINSTSVMDSDPMRIASQCTCFLSKSAFPRAGHSLFGKTYGPIATCIAVRQAGFAGHSFRRYSFRGTNPQSQCTMSIKS